MQRNKHQQDQINSQQKTQVRILVRPPPIWSPYPAKRVGRPCGDLESEPF